jgi:hypothetical protein
MIELAFGRYVFPSQQAARRECERRLSRYSHGDYIGGEDREFFLALLEERYPDFREAFYGDEDPDLCDRPSLQHVQWRQFSPLTPFNNFGIRAIREDGKWSPVSWRRCIDSCTHETWVVATARDIVAPQHARFLADNRLRFGNVSAISGATADFLVCGYHMRDFHWLLRDWAASEGVVLKEVPLKRTGRTMAFDSEELAESWSDYHREHAVLVPMTQYERLGRVNTSGSSK